MKLSILLLSLITYQIAYGSPSRIAKALAKAVDSIPGMATVLGVSVSAPGLGAGFLGHRLMVKASENTQGIDRAIESQYENPEDAWLAQRVAKCGVMAAGAAVGGGIGTRAGFSVSRMVLQAAEKIKKAGK